MSTFSTSSRQKRLKTLSFFTLLTSKCASRHNGVHFFDTFSTSELPKVVRTPSVFNILTSKCASRHNAVHFFDIGTSKSGPTMVCFVHFDFQMCFAPQRRALFQHRNFQNPTLVCFFVHFDFKMCFAPQRRALFRHRNFQKWSDHGVLCTFWLPNVLRATTACTFSTSQRPKVVRSSSVLSILTWKCASRHNGVHFFMSHLASWLRTRRFSEPTFRPSGATNHWKNTVNRDFPIFSRIYLFFLLIFSLLTLLTSAFQLSILSEVSLLNFLRIYIPVVPARGGAEVASRIYKNILIYRTCTRRAPAKPVRACTLRKLCPVWHVTFKAPLRTSLSTLDFSHCTLGTPHFTLHTALFALHTSHFTLHTSHFTVHTSHFSLLITFCTLHTSHFTLHPSRPTLDTALFTLHTSSHLSSSHLIPAHLSHLISSHMSSK